VLPNIPANFGPVRARATCVNNGVTTLGQSPLFTIPANGSVNVPPILLGSATPVPTAINISSQMTLLTQAGATTQLAVSAVYADGTSRDITSASAGTLYNISNPGIATVSSGGLVTAVSSGNVVIQAVNEGAQSIITIQVVLAGTSHGGIPDSWAIAHGLDPNDPNMPFEDPDHDGLTNLQEFQFGTDPHNPDTDGDGLTDGQEVLIYHTNPLVADTDGDGIPDGLEVQLGTDPLDPNSHDYGRAVASMEIRASAFTLVVNSLNATASTQLSVIGHLIDGHSLIDLTSTHRETHYSSSNLSVCNFGVPDGMIFAGVNGNCTITATNNGHTATSQGLVQSFSPSSVSFVTIPGFANSVAVSGQFAYVAAGGTGLQVVDLSPDRTNPQIVSSLSLPGNANDVTLSGKVAYLALGSAGLAVVDISNPLSPQLLGTLITSNALDVAVRGTTVFIANGNGLVLADVTNPASPSQISSLPLNGLVQGVDVDTQRKLAVVTAGTNGIYVVDISNPSAPVVLGATFTGDARDVALRGNVAFVADFQNSTTSVDISNPSAPVVLSHILDPNLGGFLQDIVLSGNFALAADVKFFNGIPITDISDPTNLQARAILNFTQRDDNAMGIAADETFVYLATEHANITKFGSFGDSRLYIGQYQVLMDNAGIPPTAAITAPAPGSLVVAGSTVTAQVTATDDVKVAAVNFFVNGQAVSTDINRPYTFTFTAPTSPGPLVLGANALDLGNNVGVAPNVVINVIPDPGTSVAGRVVDINGTPLAGATVTSLGGHSAISEADGTFLVGDAPTATGAMTANAEVVINGVQLVGVSAVATPVPLGITNVGDITVTGAASFVQIPGFANAVAVSGDFGFVAAGGQGLQVVSLSHDRTNPQIAGSLAIPGNANDVTLVGNLAYLAMGQQGLAVVDITTPSAPQLLGTLQLPNNAMNVVVRGLTAFVTVQPVNTGGSADAAVASNGNQLILVDVTNPAAMSIISSTMVEVAVGPNLAWGVDVDNARHLAAVAVGGEGVYLLDVTNPAQPAILSSVFTGDARAVAIRGNSVFVADFFNSLISVDISDPANPFIASQTPVKLGGRLNDLALSGNFALGSDISFANSVPIVDISNPASLQPRTPLNFTARNDHGMGLALDNDFVYLVTEHDNFDRGGSFGDSRLYIGQFQVLQDNAGIPPVVSITSPAAGATVIAGTPVRVQVNATDDVGVPAVNFLINGQVVFTGTPPPYQFTFTAPPVAGPMTLGATAVDLGGNVGTAQDVQINIIPDPGTTVTGRVVDGNGVPIARAEVSTFSKFSALTAVDGTFSIGGVPTISGPIIVSIAVNANGTVFSAKSASLAPVAGGITNVGDIVIAIVPQWTQLSPIGGPPVPRFELGQAAFDVTTDRMIIFGGLPEFGIAGDVWVLSHASSVAGQPQWTMLNPLPDPLAGAIAPRSDYAAAYDGAHNRLIVFSGFTDCPIQFVGCSVPNDVWVLENANGLGGTPGWTKLSPHGIGPTGRADATAVYDPSTNTLIVFGGQGFTPNFFFGSFPEVWILTNANGLNGTPTWMQLSPSGGPPAGPIAATAVYDPASNRMTVFGGTQTESTSFDAVWILTNANGQGGAPQWINLIPEASPGAPSGRSFHSAVNDPSVNGMIVFGGTPDFNTYLSDTWILTGANGLGDTASWLQLAPTGAPTGRCCHVSVFDPASNRMIMFGGLTFFNIVNDTWVLSDANGLATMVTTGGSVSGQVSLADGTLAADAVVQVTTTDGGATFSTQTRTDANGAYRISGIPAGRTFKVRGFDPSGISFRDSLDLTVSDGQTQNVNLTLPGVATVRITVLLADGTPVNGARVTIRDSFKQYYRLAGLTGADGSLEIPDVPEGGFSIQAQDPGRLAAIGTFNGTVGASDAGLTISGTITASALVFKVLVASGVTDLSTGISVDTAEVFDSATGTWAPTQNSIPNKPPDFAGGFCAANMAALGNGRSLFAGGGCSDAGVTTNAASLYIPGPNEWFSTNPMNFGRTAFGMLTLDNGNGFAFAGCAGGCSGPNILGQGIFQVGPSAETYNIQSSAWTVDASLNQGRGGMGNGNFNQTAATLQDGRVLACNGNDGFSTSFDSCELYDPAANQWTFTASIGETGAHPVAVLLNGKVLAVMNDGLSAQLFDPVAQSWSPAASLSLQQAHGILTVLTSGDVLFSGGNDANGPVNTVQVYHPGTDSWTVNTPMSVSRAGHIAVLLADGRVLVAGGTTANSVVLNSAELFDPTSGSWSPTGSMSQGRAGASAVGFTTFP
jgi:hypothetical protein